MLAVVNGRAARSPRGHDGRCLPARQRTPGRSLRQTIHLASLVEDLRLLTQVETGSLPLHLSAVSPAALVAEAAARFTPLAQDAGIALESPAEPGLPAVQADAGHMQQGFDNLLTNALGHTEPEGAIHVTAGQAHSGASIRFGVSNTGHLPARAPPPWHNRRPHCQ